MGGKDPKCVLKDETSREGGQDGAGVGLYRLREFVSAASPLSPGARHCGPVCLSVCLFAASWKQEEQQLREASPFRWLAVEEESSNRRARGTSGEKFGGTQSLFTPVYSN